LFSTSNRLMRAFGPFVEPTSTLLTIRNANNHHCGAVRPETISHDRPWRVIASYRALKKIEPSPAITAFRRENLKHLALMIHGLSGMVGLAIDPHEHLVQMPAPL
jgi:hypothetical protein